MRSTWMLAALLLAACGQDPEFRFKEIERCGEEPERTLQDLNDLQKIQLKRMNSKLTAQIIAPLTCTFNIANPKATYEKDRVVLSVDHEPLPQEEHGEEALACICMRHLQFDLLRPVQPGTPIIFVADGAQYASGNAP